PLSSALFPYTTLFRSAIECGLTREELRSLLPPGGARNALDCALWELESHRAQTPVWQLAGVETRRPLLTTFTVSARCDSRSQSRSEEHTSELQSLRHL